MLSIAVCDDEIIFLDIIMEDLDGMGTAQCIREKPLVKYLSSYPHLTPAYPIWLAYHNLIQCTQV